MTAVLSTLAMMPQSAQTPAGIASEAGPEAHAPVSAFEALLSSDETGTTWVRPQQMPPIESEPLRSQGPQLPREEDVWPTAAMPIRPPLDGQAVTASAPGAPDGRSGQMGLGPQAGGANAPLPMEWAPTVTPEPVLPFPEQTPQTRPQHPSEPAPRPVVAPALGLEPMQVEPMSFDGVALEPVQAEPGFVSDLFAPTSPDADNRPVVVRMQPQLQSQMPAEPRPEPTLPARIDPNGMLRVELDAELAVEVRPVAKGVEVTLDGTPQALQPMDGIEQELDAALDDAGSNLAQFRQQQRSPNAPSQGPSDDDGTGVMVDDTEPVQVRAGASLIHVVA